MIKRAAWLLTFLMVVCLTVPLIGEREKPAEAALTIGRVHRTFQPLKHKLFILVIGSDAREGNPDNVRADALHIVGLNTKTMRGGILNFPRDSWVPIPGYRTGRINESLTAGGPERVAQTVESLTGIRLDYWVMTGFHGFRKIMHSIGPVPYKINQDIFDPNGSGAALRKGQKRLVGEEALAFVRTRHNFPNGDIDRTTNQARFLLALLRKFRAEIDRDPSDLIRWMAIVRKRTRLDITPKELFRLAILTAQVRPSRVGNVTVPVTIGSAGAASVVFIQPGAQAIYERFKRTASL